MPTKGLTFVAPTVLEVPEVDVSHLRVEFGHADSAHRENPFELFSRIGTSLLEEMDLTPDEVVVEIQQRSGSSLNVQGILNMRSWAEETRARETLQESGEWSNMTRSDRISALYGVDIDFGELPEAEELTA